MKFNAVHSSIVFQANSEFGAISMNGSIKERLGLPHLVFLVVIPIRFDLQCMICWRLPIPVFTENVSKKRVSVPQT